MRSVFIGEVPLTFYIEVILRTVVIYLSLVLSMRLMGKRMASQLTRTEMASLVSLAAAIGIAIQAPERGLLPAILACLVIIFVERVVARMMVKSKRFENFIRNESSTVVHDGILDLKVMRKNELSCERVLAELRSHGIMHLGQVKAFCFEPDGSFSLEKNEEPRAGLIIIPEWDGDFLNEIPIDPVMISCANCGVTHAKTSSHLDCPRCHSMNWKAAALPVPSPHEYFPGTSSRRNSEQILTQ